MKNTWFKLMFLEFDFFFTLKLFFSLLFFQTIIAPPLFSQSISKNSLWKLESCLFKFKSETQLEAIIGSGKSCEGSANIKEKKVQIQIDLRDWKTPNNLQTSHLQENYLETQKFPMAIFEGIITKFDEKSGKGEITGSLNLHGIIKSGLNIPFEVSEQGEALETNSEFMVYLSDHGIEVPKILVLKLNPMIQMKAKVTWRKP